jgi:hypothetical protein
LAEDQQRADGKVPVVQLPRGDKAEQCRQQSESALHRRGLVIAFLPFQQQGRIVEREPRRLLGDIDEDRAPANTAANTSARWAASMCT